MKREATMTEERVDEIRLKACELVRYCGDEKTVAHVRARLINKYGADDVAEALAVYKVKP